MSKPTELLQPALPVNLDTIPGDSTFAVPSVSYIQSMILSKALG